MTIKTGDKIPACTLKIMGEKGPTDITTDDIFTARKSCCSLFPARSHPVAA